MQRILTRLPGSLEERKKKKQPAAYCASEEGLGPFLYNHPSFDTKLTISAAKKTCF